MVMYAENIDVGSIKDAVYKCQTCSKKWKQRPEPVTCLCGGIWIDWENWNEWAKSKGRK